MKPVDTYMKNITRYVIGFVASLGLTLSAYFLVERGVVTMEIEINTNTIMLFLAALAFTQMVVQLIFFLHINTEAKPRLKLLAFGFMTLVLVIIVVGSIWIMNHLNYNMMQMSPSEREQYMLERLDGGF